MTASAWQCRAKPISSAHCPAWCYSVCWDHPRGDSKGNISLEQEKKELIVQAGRTKIRLAMLDIPENLFLMPKPNPNAKTIGAVDKLMIALAGVMRSLSDDTSRADYQGIALIPENGQLTLFATDSQTILLRAWVNDAQNERWKKRVILSRRRLLPNRCWCCIKVWERRKNAIWKFMPIMRCSPPNNAPCLENSFMQINRWIWCRF